MSPSPSPRSMRLSVSNLEQLESGCRPSHLFQTSGGSIGSRAATWQLSDRGGGIAAHHLEILFTDNAFCLIDSSGATRMNQQTGYLGPGRTVLLNEGDEIQVGPYRLTVQMDPTDLDDTGAAQHGIDDVLGLGDPFAGLPPAQTAAVADYGRHADMRSATDEILDPLLALDMMDALGNANASAAMSLDPLHYGLSSRPGQQADLADTTFEAFSNATHPIYTARSSADAPHDDARSTATRAMLAGFERGLGIALGPLSAEEAHCLGEEAGRALACAIQGVSALYADGHDQTPSTRLLGRRLQPLEDNPLRMAAGYADTVAALFSRQRSPVHLAPDAAFAESLREIGRHHDAVVDAIGHSLAALLSAFSPRLLEQRFGRYAQSQAAASAPGWQWSMYGHYYDELVSSRQQGFDKMFWEVFDQAYDRSMRRGA